MGKEKADGGLAKCACNIWMAECEDRQPVNEERPKPKTFCPGAQAKGLPVSTAAMTVEWSKLLR